MIVVGLTGSIAMGKTEAAHAFRKAGIPVFDADAEVHALYASAEGVALLEEIVPEAIQSGKVDRQRLSAALVRRPDLLPKVESRVHGKIRERRAAFLEAAEAARHDIVVLEVPLLFETGGDEGITLSLVISSPAAQQKKRALARPGMTEAKLDLILRRQMSDAQKRKRADVVIENTGSLVDLTAKISQFVKGLRQQGSAHA